MENTKETFSVNTSESDKNKRIDKFLTEVMPEATRSYLQKLIDKGYVEVQGKKVTKSGNKLKGNEIINISIPEDEPLDLMAENIPLDIIYEDSDLVVINKQANLVVHPAYGNYNGTLVNALLYHINDLSTINGVIRPGIVHRLDKDTTGIIVVAKNDKAHLRLSEMFKNKELEKSYICITNGIFKEKKGRIENFIGRDLKDRKKMAVVIENGRVAISNYEILDEGKGNSLVKVTIETGRTHQIRVHMKFLNHPIIGDTTYGSAKSKITRQMLHAYNLKFEHPTKKIKLNLIAPLPEDFKKIAKSYDLDLSKIDEAFK